MGVKYKNASALWGCKLTRLKGAKNEIYNNMG